MLTPEQKERQRAYFKEYYKRNREQIQENNRLRSRLYWEANKTYQLEYKKYRYLKQKQERLEREIQHLKDGINIMKEFLETTSCICSRRNVTIEFD
jgi:cell division protein FtsB